MNVMGPHLQPFTARADQLVACGHVVAAGGAVWQLTVGRASMSMCGSCVNGIGAAVFHASEAEPEVEPDIVTPVNRDRRLPVT